MYLPLLSLDKYDKTGIPVEVVGNATALQGFCAKPKPTDQKPACPKSTLTDNKGQDQPSDQLKKLRLWHHSMTFAILGVGLTLALLVFMAELVVAKCASA